jgi:hypothetical protein
MVLSRRDAFSQAFSLGQGHSRVGLRYLLARCRQPAMLNALHTLSKPVTGEMTAHQV